MTPYRIEQLARGIAENEVCIITPKGDGWLAKDSRAYIAKILRSTLASEMPYPSQGPKYDESDRANVLEVTYDGSTLVLPYEARDVLWDYFEDWDYEGIKLTMKTMTRAEIEALDEFEGF